MKYRPHTQAIQVAAKFSLTDSSIRHGERYYAPVEGALSDDARLTSVCLSHTSGLTREQRGLGRPKLAYKVAHVTRDSDTTSKVKSQGHQAALLTAALTREAGAAVTVRTYWAWETTATLRLLGGRNVCMSCRHAYSLFVVAE